MSKASTFSRGREAKRPAFEAVQGPGEQRFRAEVQDDGHLYISKGKTLRAGDVMNFRNWLSATFGPECVAAKSP